MQLAPPCRLILVEGIPCSGKTTTAEWVGDQLAAAGVDARWVHELDDAHPVIDREVTRQHREADYAERCIERWERFAKRVEREKRPGVWVLEACLFQKTVRFMVEHDRPKVAREGYVDAVGPALAPLAPRLVYLVQPRPREFLANHFVARKSAQWLDRIAAYTETTECAKRNGWHGREGTFDFYAHYRRICDALVARLSMPSLTVDTSGDSPDASRRQIAAWLDPVFS